MTAREVLDGIKTQLEAATPGPWEVERYAHGGGRIWRNSPRGIRFLVADTFEGEGNRELLAAAPATVARLTAALEAVLEQHTPEKKWEPYEGAGYSFNTRDEALQAGGEEDLGAVAIEAGPQYFEICKECGRVESDQLSETGEEWGYRESLWPCPTVAAIESTLKEGQ